MRSICFSTECFVKSVCTYSFWCLSYKGSVIQKDLGPQIFSLQQDFFFLRLSAESFILLLIFKESEGVKFSYLSGIDDPLALCFSDDFENPTSFPWLSIYWREHKFTYLGYPIWKMCTHCWMMTVMWIWSKGNMGLDSGIRQR